MAQYQAAPTPPPAQDPNQTLSIVGLVLAVLCSLVGLIISIIAFNRSKALGIKNNIALAGIIVAISLMVIGFIVNITTGTFSALMNQ